MQYSNVNSILHESSFKFFATCSTWVSIRVCIHNIVKNLRVSACAVRLFLILSTFSLVCTFHWLPLDTSWAKALVGWINDYESLLVTWSSTSVRRGESEVNMLLWIQSDNEWWYIDNLLADAEGKSQFDLHYKSGLMSSYRMCRCLMSTRAWWMDLASPSLNTWVCNRRSKKALILRAST